jgi:hypothetical protein
MHKDELLQLHSLLCQMKRFFQESDIGGEEPFTEYESLEVSPQHIHKSKTDHKRAVFLLGKGLTNIALASNPEQMERLQERFTRLAELAPLAPVEPVRHERADHLPAFAMAALRTTAV